MSQRVDLVRNSLPSSKQLILKSVEQTTERIIFRVRAKHLPYCPACLESSGSYNGCYVRSRVLGINGTEGCLKRSKGFNINDSRAETVMVKLLLAALACPKWDGTCFFSCDRMTPAPRLRSSVSAPPYQHGPETLAPWHRSRNSADYARR